MTPSLLIPPALARDMLREFTAGRHEYDGTAVQFERLGAEAFETTNPFRDSVTTLVPFAIFTVTKTDGEIKQVRFWPTETSYDPNTGKPYVIRYFAEVNKEDFMLTQDRVFAPIFRGYSFFYE